MEDGVKLSVRYYADDKIEALPDDAAEVMWTRGLARAGELQLEGFIPAESLPKLARRRRYAASVSALLASGLWTKVDGGYQITNWDYWNDALDALTRRRTTDRERQRRRRAAAREKQPEARAAGAPSVDDQTRESRDNGRVSRDVSRDVTVAEGEGDRELPGGTAKTHEAMSRDGPPPRCRRHINTADPPSCGPCADARKARNRWETEQAARRREAPQCRTHRGQPAHNCSLCRAEELSAS